MARVPRYDPHVGAIDVEPLLVKLDAFIDKVHVVRDAISMPPTKQHLSACINYADLIEMRDEFIHELVHTVVPFVYSERRQKQILNKLLVGRSEAGAWSELQRRSKAKFRTANLRGQFSELLLCNVLQHYFRAAPLLRKMPLTTNPQTERHGADAIHVGVRNGRYVLYLGEAKTYDRKKDALKAALTDAIDDAVGKHYSQHRRELDCYIYEDFLSPELEEVADGYKSGKLADIEVEIVCVATFDQLTAITGASRAERLANALACVRRLATPETFKTVLARIPADVLPRMNYVVFPTTGLQGLIDAFHSHMAGA